MASPRLWAAHQQFMRIQAHYESLLHPVNPVNPVYSHRRQHDPQITTMDENRSANDSTRIFQFADQSGRLIYEGVG
jgi:hypothetical protein